MPNVITAINTINSKAGIANIIGDTASKNTKAEIMIL